MKQTLILLKDVLKFLEHPECSKAKGYNAIKSRVQEEIMWIERGILAENEKLVYRDTNSFGDY